jgi:hypothetical protein
MNELREQASHCGTRPIFIAREMAAEIAALLHFDRHASHTLPNLAFLGSAKVISLIKILILLVQLGGLEPPTSCSTDRRSNQLSYNCIRCGPWNERA